MAETEPHVNVDYVLNRTIGMIDEKLETGHSKRQIREDLAGMGFDADTANALIEQVDGPRRHEPRLQGDATLRRRAGLGPPGAGPSPWERGSGRVRAAPTSSPTG